MADEIQSWRRGVELLAYLHALPDGIENDAK
jgi:hypothetical protein